jgi:uncharacterized protein YcnI
MKLGKAPAMALLIGTLGFGWAEAASAYADVTVTAGSAVAASPATLDFTVSADRPDAATDQIQVRLPTGPTFDTAFVRPIRGWTVSVSPAGAGAEADPAATRVTTVTWTAQSAADAIAPGQFEVFSLHLAALPTDRAELTFDAVQTYADGQVTEWGGTATDPGHPAPTLTLHPAALETTPTVLTPAKSAPVAAAKHSGAGGPDRRAVRIGLTTGGLFILLGIAATAVPRRRIIETPSGN